MSGGRERATSSAGNQNFMASLDSLKLPFGIDANRLLGAAGIGGGGGPITTNASASNLSAVVSPNITVITGGGTANPVAGGSANGTANATPAIDASQQPNSGGNPFENLLFGEGGDGGGPVVATPVVDGDIFAGMELPLLAGAGLLAFQFLGA